MLKLFQFRFLSRFIRSHSQSVALGEKEMIGNLIKLPKSQVGQFNPSFPEDYTKFLDQCREAHLFYSQDIHSLMQGISQETDSHKKILLTGAMGSGKSMALLAALLFARQRGMLILHFPTLFSLSGSNHTLEPYESDAGKFYEQDADVINWWKYFTSLNPDIVNASTMDSYNYDQEHMHSYNVRKGEPIGDAIKRSIEMNSYPSKVLSFLIEQILKVPNRPPILIAIDGLNALFCRTEQKLDERGEFYLPRQLTVMRTFYDLVFSEKFADLLTKEDTILAAVTKRGAQGVKAIRSENKVIVEREKSASFFKIFRPQSVREDPILNLKEIDTAKYPNGRSYELVEVTGELLKMDILSKFKLGSGEANLNVGIEKVLKQARTGEVTLEVKDGKLNLDYKHLDDVAKEKIYQGNYLWRAEMLLGEEGMEKVFKGERPFTEIEMRKWEKNEVFVAVGEAVKDLWGRPEIDRNIVEEIYPLSSFGNPRLVYKLCRMVFEH